MVELDEPKSANENVYVIGMDFPEKNKPSMTSEKVKESYETVNAAKKAAGLLTPECRERCDDCIRVVLCVDLCFFLVRNIAFCADFLVQFC